MKRQFNIARPRRICIVGLWHQATVLAACFAEMGHNTVGVGSDHRVVADLSVGRAPVVEPELDDMLLRNIQAGRLKFTTSYADALVNAEFVFLALDTPVDEMDRPVLTEVFEAAEAIAEHRAGSLVLCVTSQLPVGTSEHLLGIIQGRNPKFDCAVAYIPEFLRLSEAVHTFFEADRFVIGSQRRDVAERVAELYEPLRRPLLLTNLRSAEMIKHASNTFLATSISFVNEVADICEQVGADIIEVVAGMKLDQRIGARAALSAGLGFAGGTLGRDIRALQELGAHHRTHTALLDAVSSVNSSRAKFVLRRLGEQYESINGLQIGVFGLTYKAGTSTLRRSIALDIIAQIVNAGGRVRAFDPLADLNSAAVLPNFEVVANPYEVAEQGDAVLLLTEWTGIKDLDWARLRKLMRSPLLIDTRNLLDPELMGNIGFVYMGVGRRACVPAFVAQGA
jgi:UDPglucose 6-dehydrogenase